jgi:hypothetical protein
MPRLTKSLLVAMLCFSAPLFLAGCDSSSGESTTKEAPDRDGYQGQMGVMAGDPNDYGN